MDIKSKLLDGINFQAIHNHMVKEGWTYWHEDTSPSVKRLRDAAEELIEIILSTDKKNYRCSTGGFYACKWSWDDANPEYELFFAIENSYAKQS